MSNAPPIAAWQQLPDPDDPAAPKGRLVDIELGLADWRKIVSKHMNRNRQEPWEDLLPTNILSALRSQPLGPYDKPPTREAVTQATEVLESEIRRCLSRPLVMTYESMTAAGCHTHIWWLILPCGATAIVHRLSSKNILKTCYYSGAAGRNTGSTRRWRVRARDTVMKHARRDTAQRLVLPDGCHLVEEDCEIKMRIRFITPVDWGFDPTQEHVPWTGAIPAWHRAQSKSRLAQPSPNVLRERQGGR